MKIMFDVDNVLADSMTCWCKKASQYSKSAVSKNDVRSHKIYIATSRPKRLTDFVLQWLDKMKIYYDSFHSLGPRQLKAKIGADALVDDAPEQIQEFVRTGRVGFIYNQPWNAKAKIRKAIRVRKVNDVLAHYGIT